MCYVNKKKVLPIWVTVDKSKQVDKKCFNHELNIIPNIEVFIIMFNNEFNTMHTEYKLELEAIMNKIFDEFNWNMILIGCIYKEHKNISLNLTT